MTNKMTKVARTTKFKKISFHLFCIFTIAYYCINGKTPKTLNITKVERFLPDMKHILIWNEVQDEFEVEGQEYFLKRNCKHYNCYLTTNRSLFGNILLFDSIIFNVQDVSKGVELPEVRSPSQMYVFVANDSATKYPVCDPVFENFFNWTWTYKIDSTIPYSFISVYNLQDVKLGNNFEWIRTMNPITDKQKKLLSSKTKAVATLLDNCKSSSKREVFLKDLQNELEKYNLTVDVFGKCGRLDCRRKTMRSCFYMLSSYHFYLAMEESIAEDYVTSKVLYGYNLGVVPIVYGGAKYYKFLPPDSYIEASKLGVKTVARKVNEAINNKTLYYDYFRWNNYYVVKGSQPLDACVLCEALNNPRWTEKARIASFRKWWNPSYKTLCNQQKNFLLSML